MEFLQRKELTTRRSLKYTYYVSPLDESATPAAHHPALFFIHGFPDSAHLWAGVVATLRSLPNRIIIPDCLGYAGTDKPDDTKLYAYKDQADDLEDILKAENATSSIIIGHDWGSALTQRTYLHKRELFSGVVLVNTPYMVPSDQPFDLAAVNEYTAKALGYPQFSYWEFFTASDAPEIIDRNLERMWQALHGDVEDWMKKLFCVPNAFRNFILGTEEVPVKEYANQMGRKEQFMQQFSPAEGGFGPALQMYKATAANIQSMSDATIPKECYKIEVPTLLFMCTKDAVCVPEMMTQAKNEGLVPDLTEVELDCAHWSPMEAADELAAHIKEFVITRFLVD